MRTALSQIASAACIAVLLAGASLDTARAQSASGDATSPEAVTPADALIEQGIAQRRAGDDPGALATFRRAYEVSPSPRAAAQLGLVHQALGQWVEAHERLNEALAAASDPWVGRNRAALEQALTVVDGEVGTVEVIISGSIARGTRATLGSREITSFPMTHAVVVVAGEEALEVSAPGHGTVRRDVRVRAGQLSRVTIELRPDTTAASTATDTTSTTSEATSELVVETGAGGSTDEERAPQNDEWIVWVIIGGAIVVGAGIAVAVVASQESLEPPLPGTVGAVELLRF